VYIPKAGKKGELRPLGIPAVRDRVCQQALAQRLAPIFEPDLDDSSYGYRPGRSPHDAMRKIWREVQAGSVWVVDADLRNFFGSVDHTRLMQLGIPPHEAHLFQSKVPARSNRLGPPIPREVAHLFQRKRPTHSEG